MRPRKFTLDTVDGPTQLEPFDPYDALYEPDTYDPEPPHEEPTQISNYNERHIEILNEMMSVRRPVDLDAVITLQMQNAMQTRKVEVIDEDKPHIPLFIVIVIILMAINLYLFMH